MADRLDKTGLSRVWKALQIHTLSRFVTTQRFENTIDSIPTSDTKDNVTTFNSGDSTSPSSYSEISKINSGETHSSLFQKLSTAVKNIRYIWSIIGNTDISSLGDGTVSGALDSLSSSKVDKSGDTMTGDLSIDKEDSQGFIEIHREDLDMRLESQSPSEDESIGGMKLYDSNGDLVAYIESKLFPSGSTGTQFYARRTDSQEQQYSHGFRILIDRQGNGSVAFSSTSFRDAWADGMDVVKKSGDTSRGSQTIKDSSYTIGTTPSSNYYGKGWQLQDSAGNVLGYLRSIYQTDGGVGLQIEARRSISGSWKYNTLNMRIDDSGNAQININGTGVAAAWRNAIGAVNKAGDTMTGKLILNQGLGVKAGSSSTAPPYFLCLLNSFADGGDVGYVTQANMKSAIGLSVSKVTTIASVISVNSTNATISGVQVTKWGNLVSLHIWWTNKNAISVPANGNIGNVNVGTLVSAYRPVYDFAGWSSGDNAGAQWYSITAAGAVTLGACEGTNVARTIAASTRFDVFSTYIVN